MARARPVPGASTGDRKSGQVRHKLQEGAIGQSSHSKRYEVNVQKTVITNYQREKFRQQPNFQLHHKE